MEIGLVLPVKVVPSDRVPFHGPVPVTAIFRVADCPGQIVTVPLNKPVGLGFTVMMAEPLPVLLQELASETLDTVYVVVKEGLTLNVYGLVLMLLTVTGVVPSVYVRLHGGVPVKATDAVALFPLQMVILPEITAVGSGSTPIVITLLFAGLFAHTALDVIIT